MQKLRDFGPWPSAGKTVGPRFRRDDLAKLGQLYLYSPQLERAWLATLQKDIPSANRSSRAA
jgi:hypothetical protein